MDGAAGCFLRLFICRIVRLNILRQGIKLQAFVDLKTKKSIYYMTYKSAFAGQICCIQFSVKLEISCFFFKYSVQS